MTSLTAREAVAEYAGCRYASRSRDTGTLILVLNGGEAGLDTDDGVLPWSTVCDEHGSVCGHSTLALARSHAHDPLGWCEDCIAANRRCSDCGAPIPYAPDGCDVCVLCDLRGSA
jgi:hypothetical protein